MSPGGKSRQSENPRRRGHRETSRKYRRDGRVRAEAKDQEQQMKKRNDKRKQPSRYPDTLVNESRAMLGNRVFKLRSAMSQKKKTNIRVRHEKEKKNPYHNNK